MHLKVFLLYIKQKRETEYFIIIPWKIQAQLKDLCFFKDRKADGNFMPAVDEQQDSKILSLTEKNGQTVIKFQRAIKACDENDLSIAVSEWQEIVRFTSLFLRR